MHSGIVEMENVTLSFILTLFLVSQEALRSIIERRPFSFSILNVTVGPARSRKTCQRRSSPAWECQGRKQAEAEDPRDDSATITPQQLRRDPSPSQVSGVAKIPIKLLWMVKIAEKVIFACFEPVWPHASIGKENRAHSNKEPRWLLAEPVSPHHTTLQTTRGQPHTASKYALSISLQFSYFHHICLAFHDFWSLNGAFTRLLWSLIIGTWNWLSEWALQLWRSFLREPKCWPWAAHSHKCHLKAGSQSHGTLWEGFYDQLPLRNPRFGRREMTSKADVWRQRSVESTKSFTALFHIQGPWSIFTDL